jgi:hypothetical protein
MKPDDGKRVSCGIVVTEISAGQVTPKETLERVFQHRRRLALRSGGRVNGADSADGEETEM